MYYLAQESLPDAAVSVRKNGFTFQRYFRRANGETL